MKILYLTSWYPTKKNPGSGIFIKEHASAINAVGNEIVVYAFILEKNKNLFKVQTRDYNDENGIRTIELIISSIFKDILYYFPIIQQIFFFRIYYKLIQNSFSPDIIHSNVVFPSGIFGNLLSKKINKPYVITEHWSKLPYILSFPLLKTRISNAYTNSSEIITVSNFLKNRLLTSLPNLDKNKFEIIPNIVQSNVFFYKKKENTDNTIHFTAIATWATKRQPDKKPELFIEALSNIQKSYDKKFKLTMIGGGNRVSELKKLCEDKNLKTEFLGYLSKNDIAQVLHKTDYFVHSSTIETFGIVAAEALITGTPVICSNVGALPEIIDDTNGVLCENTVRDWEKGLQKAMKSHFNHKEISDSTIDKFSLAHIGNMIDYIYKNILLA